MRNFISLDHAVLTRTMQKQGSILVKNNSLLPIQASMLASMANHRIVTGHAETCIVCKNAIPEERKNNFASLVCSDKCRDTVLDDLQKETDYLLYFHKKPFLCLSKAVCAHIKEELISHPEAGKFVGKRLGNLSINHHDIRIIGIDAAIRSAKEITPETFLLCCMKNNPAQQITLRLKFFTRYDREYYEQALMLRSIKMVFPPQQIIFH